MTTTWTVVSLSFLVAVCRAAVLSFHSSSAPLEVIAKLDSNKDVRYDKWLEPQRILYRFDESSYSQHEKELIMEAMSRIAADMNKCISFQEYEAVKDAGLDNIYISKTLNDGSIPPTCFTFYGRLLRAAGQGQKMAIHDGPNGCMDSLRDIMKILVNVLGLRNEYNRPDREAHVKLHLENLLPELQSSNLLNEYNASQVDFDRLPFDYNSITFPLPSQWAQEKSVWYEFPAEHSIPKLDHLSKSDCIGLSWMYGCDESKCMDHYNVIPAALQEAAKVEAKQIPLESTTLAAVTHAEVTTEAATTVHAELSSTPAHTETSSVAATEATTAVVKAVEIQASTTELPIKPTEHTEQTTQAVIVESSSAASTQATTQAASTVASNFTEVVHIQETTSASVTVTEVTTPIVLNLTLADVIIPRQQLASEPSTVLHVDSTTAALPLPSSTVAAIEQSSTTVEAVTIHSSEASTAAEEHHSSSVATEASTSMSSSSQEPALKMIIISPQVNNSEVSFAAVEVQSVNVTHAPEVISSTFATTLSSSSVAAQTSSAVLDIQPADNIIAALNPKLDEIALANAEINVTVTSSPVTSGSTHAVVVVESTTLSEVLNSTHLTV